VVEGLQPRYIETAKMVSPAYLVSALNILNEAEINYKMARNKRLHVEMTMIKLTFLQQAIELSFDSQSGTLIKKKRVSGPVAVKFDPLQSMQIKGAPVTPPESKEAKLYITPGEAVGTAAPVADRPVAAKPAARLLVAEPVVATETFIEPTAKTVPAKPKDSHSGKRSLLDTLRDQHLHHKTDVNKKAAIPVTEETLKEYWKCFTEKLKKEFKHSVVTVFNNAELEVVNEQHFSITVSASLEQKFIEQEKVHLLEYLKECFNNRNIGFTFRIKDQAREVVVSDATMNSREKYLKLIEQYPMIKELKDRLKLELDY
jgi:DNA polymerase-3 subunit gamma/tau